MNREKMIRGTGTALVTPFHEDGSIDYVSFNRLIEYQIAGGVEMLVPLGSTGENPTITIEERAEVIRRVVEIVNGRALVIAGTGTNDTASSIKYTREAMAAGADAALIVTPYYNKPTPNGLIAHFHAIADVGLPLILYNVPGRTGLNMHAETTLRAAEIQNVVAIKEASADLQQCMEIIRNAPQGFWLLSGEDYLTVPLIAMGAEGVISVSSNEVPGEFSRMVRFALAGQFDEARAIHYALSELMKVNFIESNPGPVKAALAMMGIIEEHYRLPMVRMRPESRRAVREVLERIDMIVLEELAEGN
jgi:4-hydroxy-tetrahydrodipicolinate synthase